VAHSDAKESTVIDEVRLRLAQVRRNEVCSVFLLGESGIGKSTAMRQLEQYYWDSFDITSIGRMPQLIPISLELRKTAVPSARGCKLRHLALQELDGLLTEDDMSELHRQQIRIVWLFDGYDEMERVQSIGSELAEWGLSVVSSRQHFLLAGDLLSFLTPPKTSFSSQHVVLYLRGFNQEQKREYVTKILARDNRLRGQGPPAGFAKAIESVPTLNYLASNPFLMSMIVEQIPSLATRYPQLRVLITGVTAEGEKDPESASASQPPLGVYVKSTDAIGAVLKQYYVKSLDNLIHEPRFPAGLATDFAQQCQTFCQDLACMMFERETLLADPKEAPFNKLFPSDDDTSDEAVKTSFILRAVPLERDGKYWAFLRKAFRDYYFALSNTVDSVPQAGSSGSQQVSPFMNTLGSRLFTQDRDLLQKHAELIADYPNTKQEYIRLVLSTRDKLASDLDKKLLIAGSNAISVLNYGGLSRLFRFRFDDVMDWNGIRIPYANLNDAHIFRCNFYRANLSHCTLYRAVLRGSILCGANLTGIQTGERVPLKGHDRHVTAVTFSPNGTLLASCSKDATIRLWNVEAEPGICVATLRGHSSDSWVYGVGFAPNGKLLASSASDGTVRLWDVESRKCVAALKRDSSSATYVRFVPPSGKLLAFNDDSNVRIWDAASRSCVATLTGHKKHAVSLDVSPDGRLLASGSDDTTVRIWNVESRHCVAMLTGHTKSVVSLSFSPDGHWLASGSGDTTIRIWDVEAHQCTITLEGHPHTVRYLVFAPDSRTLASCSVLDRMIRLWDVKSGRRTPSTLKGHLDEVMCLDFHREGKLLASGSMDNTVGLWNVASDHCTPPLQGHPSHAAVLSVSFSSDGRYFATCASDRTIRVWEVETGRCHAALQGNCNVPRDVTFSPNSKWLAVGLDDGAIRTLNLDSAVCTTIWNEVGVVGGVSSLSFSPDSKTLASSFDSTIRIYNVGSGDCLARLKHNRKIHSVRFSPDGKHVVAGGLGKTVRLWSVIDSRSVCAWKIGSIVYSLAFSPDGKLVACGSENSIHLFDTEAKTYIVTWQTAVLGNIHSICFHPDGQMFATAGSMGRIHFLSLESKRLVGSIRDHTAPLTSISFSPDGERLLSASCDGTTLMWEVDLPRPGLRESIMGVSHPQMDLSGVDIRGAEMDPGMRLLAAWIDESQRAFATEEEQEANLADTEVRGEAPRSGCNIA